MIALGLFLFSRHRKDGEDDTQSEKGSDNLPQRTATSTSEPAARSPESLPFKSKLRPTHRKPSREETNELLRTTIISVAKFEDMSIREALVELNRLTSEAGIPPERLKFIRGVSDNSPDDFLERRLEDIDVRNIPLAPLLKYLIDNRTIRCRVGEGFVEFRDSREQLDAQETVPLDRLEKAAPGASDPFAPE